MNFLTNINLTHNQLQNAVMHPLTNAPAGVEGQVYYNSVAKGLFVHNGTEWIGVGMGAYELPVATTLSLGGIKVSDGLAIEVSGELSTKLQTIKVNGSALTISSKAVDILIGAGTNNGEISVNGTDILLYAHPTGDGNLHVPANRTENDGKILTAGALAGVYTWEVNAPLWANIQNGPTSTVAQIDASIAASHAQNTDIGTTSQTFLIDSDNGANGVMIKASAGELQVRDNLDTAFGDLRIKNLYVEGTQTIVHSTEVNIGDNNIVLNANITESSLNSDGGISIKRLANDNITRKDAVLEYNVSTNRWQTTFGDVSGALITLPLTNKFTTMIGNGVDTTFTVTHNLNTKDVVVTIRETGGDYEVVYTDVQITNENYIDVLFAAAPNAAQYTVTIVG